MTAKDRKIVYICAPRSKTEASLLYSNMLCALLLQAGHTPLAPQVLCGTLKYDHPNAPDLEVGISLLRRCDEVWVFSAADEAMQKEITEAQNLDIPVKRCFVYGGRGSARSALNALSFEVAQYGN